MKYTEPVNFKILPDNPETTAESELTWTPEEGLQTTEKDSFNSELTLFAVQQNAISREIEFGDEFPVTPEGPSLPTDTSFKDIHAAVYFIFDTFPPDQIEIDGEAPTLQDMGLAGIDTDEFGRRIIN